MALVERVMNLEQPKISPHQLMGAIQEYALGTMSGAQVVAAFDLDAAAQTEAQALLGVIMAEADPKADVQSIKRRLKAVEFERVLFLAERLVPPFDAAAAVRARLGI